MSRRGRRWLTTEQAAEQAAQRELDLAEALGLESTRERLAFYGRLRPLVAASLESYRTLRALATSRGDRWSYTYHARKSERDLAEIDASLAVLEQWLAAKVPPALSETELRAMWGRPVSAAEQLTIDPRVQLELSLEEAAALQAWLADAVQHTLPPVARELLAALDHAMLEPPALPEL